jgi:hypothetical protein
MIVDEPVKVANFVCNKLVRDESGLSQLVSD